MAATLSVNLPTFEELTVPEVKLSAVVLRAASLHLGKYCEAYNNEFMLCKSENGDPRACLAEGKVVTECTIKFFQKLKSSCASEFKRFYKCVDRSSSDYKFYPCRKTQKAFDDCMLDKLHLARPELGYFCRVKVHKTNRPKPEPDILVLPADDLPQKLPDDYERRHAKYGSRYPFFP
ncbi:NADH dehydrogenase [ubiquinone] 1 alpha subcomplex subunit 8-like [Lycorma delicatula]|uniref:NADH dehydrogenase [ubiquinone] 1 alpha subcomplex subunit 8-like n=1 Tax=Lycorma delicatula TaxID=130591 RepID=UPI003F512AC4